MGIATKRVLTAIDTMTLILCLITVTSDNHSIFGNNRLMMRPIMEEDMIFSRGMRKTNNKTKPLIFRLYAIIMILMNVIGIKIIR